MTQAKDIPETPILEFLAMHGGIGCNWFAKVFNGQFATDNPRSVLHAMPDETPPKLALAKMRKLIKRGLVDGCPCGCRGDFELTDTGKELLELISSRAPQSTP